MLRVAGAYRLLALMAALAALGCARIAIDPWSKRHGLEETQKSYSHMLRWGEVERASRFVEPELRQEFLRAVGGLEHVRVADYEVLHVEFSERNTKALVDVSYRVYDVRRLVERGFHETQEWQRDARTGEWRVRVDLDNLRSGLAATSP